MDAFYAEAERRRRKVAGPGVGTWG